ncbi:hypothetical protein HK100_007995, partial [Physocladia obscura]
MVEFMPMFLPTLLCNTIPLIDGGETDIRALWRRMKIIYFPMEFVDHEPQTKFQRPIDTGLLDRIKTWGPEMMLLLTEIYVEYSRGDFKLVTPESVDKRVTEQKEENNPFSRFIRENLIVKQGNLMH